MTFLEKNITKLRITKEIETILSENSIGINDFEEIVLKIKTDYKNNPLDSKNIKRKYIVYNFTYIAIIIVFLLIVFLEFFQKIWAIRIAVINQYCNRFLNLCIPPCILLT